MMIEKRSRRSAKIASFGLGKGCVFSIWGEYPKPQSKCDEGQTVNENRSSVISSHGGEEAHVTTPVQNFARSPRRDIDLVGVILRPRIWARLSPNVLMDKILDREFEHNNKVNRELVCVDGTNLLSLSLSFGRRKKINSYYSHNSECQRIAKGNDLSLQYFDWFVSCFYS